MPTVLPPGPVRPTVTPTMLKDLRREAQRLKMTLIEREITNLLLFEGYDLRWAAYTGTNYAAEVGCLIERHTNLVKRGLLSLEEQGWINRGVNNDNQAYAELTTEFIVATKLAQQRYVVRRSVGSVRWRKCEGDAGVADLLHDRALRRGRGKYKDRVKSVADAFIDGIERRRSPGNESLPGRQRIVTSQVTNRGLRLIEGEGKYHA